MKISETFMSIQGEGPRTGRACWFIRAAGCNLSCEWCDTTHAMGPVGVDWPVSDLVAAYRAECGAFGAAYRAAVCITGGEPMLQPDTLELLEELVAIGADVDLMTNGSIPLDAVPAAVGLVIDIKVALLAAGRADYPAPGLFGNGRPGASDAVKFVVAGRDQFLTAAKWAGSQGLFEQVGNVYVAPAWGLVEPASLAEWILCIEPRFRLGLQTHKYIWGPGTRM